MKESGYLGKKLDSTLIGDVNKKSPQMATGLCSLSSAPPPLPAKALKEMEQISQLLNAQAKLSSLLNTVQGEKKQHSTGANKKFKIPLPKGESGRGILEYVLSSHGPNKMRSQKYPIFQGNCENVVKKLSHLNKKHLHC